MRGERRQERGEARREERGERGGHAPKVLGGKKLN